MHDTTGERGIRVRGRLSAVLMFGLLLMPGGQAQALESKVLEVFQELDENGDQRVDVTEFKKRKTSIFFMRRAGKAEPGLSFEESLVSRAEFDAADADGNGVLSSLEWITAPFTDFARFDTNSDQAISLEEFEAFAATAVR